ncbi:MAG: hypothetical protein ACRD3D_17180, partial [Terriglobia bacterium]
MFLAAGAAAQTPRVRIVEPLDVTHRVTLRGNTPPLARHEYDRGAAPDDLPLDHMLLVLSRSREQESAL